MSLKDLVLSFLRTQAPSHPAMVMQPHFNCPMPDSTSKSALHEQKVQTDSEETQDSPLISEIQMAWQVPERSRTSGVQHAYQCQLSPDTEVIENFQGWNERERPEFLLLLMPLSVVTEEQQEGTVIFLTLKETIVIQSPKALECKLIHRYKPSSPETCVLDRTNPDKLERVLKQLLLTLRDSITAILCMSCGQSLLVAHLHQQTRPF